MRTSRHTHWTAAALLGAVVLSGCAVDRYDSSYVDVFAAKAEDAVERGWVPAWMPESASDIQESHLPRDGASILAADLGSDRASISDACQLTDNPPSPALEASWFDEAAVASGAARTCDDDRFVVVVGDRLYAWTPEGVTPIEPE